MKKLLLILVFSITLLSCEKDNSSDCDCTQYEVKAKSEEVKSSGIVIKGSKALYSDEIYSDKDMLIEGDLNLNGHALVVVNGCITINGNLNGPGMIMSDTYFIGGSIQNAPSTIGEELSLPCGESTLAIEDVEYDPCKIWCQER